MRQAWKRCCEAAVLLGCLALFVGYGRGGAKVAPLIGADIRVAGFLAEGMTGPGIEIDNMAFI